MEKREQNVQETVHKLEGEVKSKESELQSLRVGLEEIKISIQQLQQIRQGYIEKLFHAQEFSPLVSEQREMREELKGKRECLERLTEGGASVTQEVSELERQLQDLQSGRLKQQLDTEEAQHTAALKELNDAYKAKVQAVEETQETLEKLRSEVSRLRDQVKANNALPSTSSNKPNKMSLDEKLDKLVLKTSRKAGLQLSTT